MTIINLLHSHYDADHLVAVKTAMSELGSPKIRVLDVAGDLYAFEGCHRLRAAQDLGIAVTLEMLDYDGTVDIDSIGLDDGGWFEHRAAAPVSEVYERVYGSRFGDAGYVSVEIVR